jgi:proteasome lid subunit RPN8/RPN11
MGKKRIKVGAGGKVRVKRDSGDDGGDSRSGTTDRTAPADRTTDDTGSSPSGDDAFHIPTGLVEDFMETRAESQFRPDETDVETVYALTGESASRADETHSFSSEQIVTTASSSQVRYRVGPIIQHVNRELAGRPSAIVKFHTHPRGTPQPSDQDRTSWRDIAEDFRDEWPNVRVLFGIHAFSREFDAPRSRAPPSSDGYRVEWRSITRDHTARLYDERADPVEVSVV